MNSFDEAIAFAQSHEIAWPRDPESDPAHWGVHHGDFGVIRGPAHAPAHVANRAVFLSDF